MMEMQAWPAMTGCRRSAPMSGKPSMCVDRVYAPGDRIILSGGAHWQTQTDQAPHAGEGCLPADSMIRPVPAGEHRQADPPGAFEMLRPVIPSRAMREEIRAVRHIALTRIAFGFRNFHNFRARILWSANPACPNI